MQRERLTFQKQRKKISEKHIDQTQLILPPWPNKLRQLHMPNYRRVHMSKRVRACTPEHAVARGCPNFFGQGSSLKYHGQSILKDLSIENSVEVSFGANTNLPFV